MITNNLVKTATSDGLYLHGYYIPAPNKKQVVLHIHGFEGNFYENHFTHVLAAILQKNNIGFLAVNTRGNGKDTDFNTTDGKQVRIGARYELLEDGHKDISAWIEFLISEGYKTIVLQGHSLGTYKVVRYLFEGKYKDRVSKLILLAPFDQKGCLLASGRTDIESFIKKAKEKILHGGGEGLITHEYADITISYKTFISWYNSGDFSKMFEFCTSDYDFPVLRKIKIPTKIIVGSKDEYFYCTNPQHPDEAMKILLANIKNSEGTIIPDAVHSFAPHEDVMAKEVLDFVLKERALDA